MSNDSVETKTLNTKIVGRGGAVSATTIQRHKPTTNMSFIRTQSNHSLFCQDNHPLFIERDGTIDVIEARLVELNDKIYIDNKIITNENSIIPDKSEEYIANLLLSVFIKEDMTILFDEDQNIIIGEHLHELRFEPNFINYSKEWINKFLFRFLNYNIFIESFVLISQMKLMADKAGITLSVDAKDAKTDVVFRASILGFGNTITKGFVPIAENKTLEKWNHYVYDVKTETSEFMLGGVQTHNSFHLGGAVLMKEVDLIPELMENVESKYEPKIRSMFTQERDTLKTNNPTTIVINKSIFTSTFPAVKKDDRINLSVGHFSINSQEFEIKVTIEQEIDVWLNNKDNLVDDKDFFSITYDTGENMFTVNRKQEDFSKLASSLSAYIGGKSPWEDVSSLFMKFWKTFSDTGPYDAVHMEILVSNIMRYKKDPHVLARLKEPYDPTMISMGKLPGVISWPLGLALEDFSKSLSQGLISDRGAETNIEKIFFSRNLTD